MRHTANLERVEQRVASWPAVVLVWQGLAVSLASSTFLSTTKALDLLQAQENLLAANDQVWETARKWSVVCLLTIVAAHSVPIPVIRTNVNSFCRWLLIERQNHKWHYQNVFQIYNDDQTSSKVACSCAKSFVSPASYSFLGGRCAPKSPFPCHTYHFRRNPSWDKVFSFQGLKKSDSLRDRSRSPFPFPILTHPHFLRQRFYIATVNWPK